MTEKPRLPPKPSHLSTWRSVRGHSPTPSEVALAQVNSDSEDDDEAILSTTIDFGTAKPLQQSSITAPPQRTPLKDIWANLPQESLSAASHSKYASALSTLRGVPNDNDDEAQWSSSEQHHVDVASWLRAGGAESHVDRPPSLQVDTQFQQQRLSSLLLRKQEHAKREASSTSTVVQTIKRKPEEVTQLVTPPVIMAPRSGKAARALYDFQGEATFNELSLKAGQCFEVLVPELRGGWSLGLIRTQDDVEQRGLVPVGWYCYIQDFTTSPAVAAAVSTVTSTSITTTTVSPLQLIPKDEDEAVAQTTQLPSSVFTLSTNSMLSTHSHSRPHDEDPRKRPASGVGTFLKGNACARQTLSAIHDGSATAKAATSEEEITSLPSVQAQEQQQQQWRGPSGLLGGRTFNRFSPFVASGAEAFILSPASSSSSTTSSGVEAVARRRLYRSRSGSLETSSAAVSESARADGGAHYIVSGAHGHGPAWKARSAPFHVVVHSPEPRWDSRGAEYTAYAVTSLFGGSGGGSSTALRIDVNEAGRQQEATWAPYDSEMPPAHSHESLSVWRRFSHFHWLGLYLARALPALALSLPPTPPKTRAGRGRLAPEFIEERRRGLAAWLARVIRHPVARTDEGVLFFLACAEEHDWNACAPRLLADASARPSLWARTFHAQFGFDVDEAHEASLRLEAFNAAFERGMSEASTEGLLGAFQAKRQAAAKTGEAYRDLSHAVLRLTTGHGLGLGAQKPVGASTEEEQESYYGPAMGTLGERGDSGATNEEGAWCWRPDCKECLAATRALQSTAQALDTVAEVYDDHARGALLLQHERLRALSRPRAQHAALMDVHKTTLARYREAIGEDVDAEEAKSRPAPAPEALALAARCETVLNVTMAEMDRVHEERVEDWVSAGRNLLDDQITLYSEILATLQEARATYDPAPLGSLATRGPILPGVQSAPLRRAPQKPAALPQPTAPVVAPSVLSSALRPVSLAGEVLGSLFSASPTAEQGPVAPPMSQRSISAGATSASGSRFGFWR